MPTTSKKNDLLEYKGHPLMRKDNIIYYGSMSDSHIIMMQILNTKKEQDMEVATKVAVQLQLTDPSVKSRDRIVRLQSVFPYSFSRPARTSATRTVS